MENRWYIQLIGEELDFNDIERSLKNYRWNLYKEQDEVFITNEDLDETNDSKEVKSHAEEFVDILNGALKCLYGDYNTVLVATIVEFDKITGDRKKNVFVKVKRSRPRIRVNLSIQEKRKPNATTIEKWLNIAEENDSVRLVLHFYKQPSWWNLYKIYEIISEDIGTENKLKKKMYVSANELSRFTGTAQSRKHIGDEARHAANKYKGHLNPMILDEAKRLIKQVFEKWIDEKLT
jgi:hypothetical protein